MSITVKILPWCVTKSVTRPGEVAISLDCPDLMSSVGDESGSLLRPPRTRLLGSCAADYSYM